MVHKQTWIHEWTDFFLTVLHSPSFRTLIRTFDYLLLYCTCNAVCRYFNGWDKVRCGCTMSLNCQVNVSDWCWRTLQKYTVPFSSSGLVWLCQAAEERVSDFVSQSLHIRESWKPRRTVNLVKFSWVVVKHLAWMVAIWRCTWSSYTSDLQNHTLDPILPNTWHYRVNAWDVSRTGMDERANLSCNLYFSAAACQIFLEDPPVRCILKLAWMFSKQPTNQWGHLGYCVERCTALSCTDVQVSGASCCREGSSWGWKPVPFLPGTGPGGWLHSCFCLRHTPI